MEYNVLIHFGKKNEKTNCYLKTMMVKNGSGSHILEAQNVNIQVKQIIEKG